MAPVPSGAIKCIFSIIFGLVLRRSQNYRVGCSFIKLLGYISTFAILLGFFFDNFAYLVDDSMNLLQHLLFVFIHKICIMNEKHIISVAISLTNSRLCKIFI